VQVINAGCGLCIDCGGIDGCVEDDKPVKVEGAKDCWLVKLQR